MFQESVFGSMFQAVTAIVIRFLAVAAVLPSWAKNDDWIPERDANAVCPKWPLQACSLPVATPQNLEIWFHSPQNIENW